MYSMKKIYNKERNKIMNTLSQAKISIITLVYGYCKSLNNLYTNIKLNFSKMKNYSNTGSNEYK